MRPLDEAFDLAIVGAGPAGMACAIAARKTGSKVVLIDEQPTPGGQVWRGIEASERFSHPKVLWSDYAAGRRTIAAFRRSGVSYLSMTQVFQIEPGWQLFLRGPEGTRALAARQLVLATGAIERPVVFSGWTLPGIMTVGAGQILLKRSGLIPDGPVWLAGRGPLLLLYAVQLLASGGAYRGHHRHPPPQRPLATSGIRGGGASGSGRPCEGCLVDDAAFAGTCSGHAGCFVFRRGWRPAGSCGRYRPFRDGTDISSAIADGARRAGAPRP